jgi:hypothetical protein
MGCYVDDEWTNLRPLVQLSKFGEYPLKLTGAADEGVDFILRLAKRLGLKTGPAHFAYESDLPHDRIIESARRYDYHDRTYLELIYDDSLVVSLRYQAGSWEDYETHEGRKVLVLCSKDGIPTIWLNNQVVRHHGIWGPPSEYVKAMREKRRKSAAKTCRICGTTATREVEVTLSEATESFGFATCSSGRRAVIGVCDDEDHVTDIVSSEHLKGKPYRTRTYTPEAW